MKAFGLFMALLLCVQFASAQDASKEEAKIQLAILLDTSNSMDGLIDQTKSQLWKIVNELSQARYNGEIPRLEIALYEYGNDNLTATSGYIRQVTDLTTDLDMISKLLFELKTNGGSEFCGKVIQTATKKLSWSARKEDLKIVYIAGNETFEQGPVPFSEAIADAKEKDIVVNTIFCGSWQEGISLKWQAAAAVAKGEYLNIDQDEKTVYIATPYDADILKLNEALNSTYVGYGAQRAARKEMQAQQDIQAQEYGDANLVSRALSKSKKAYSNSSWDLVDAYESDSTMVNSLRDDDLPENMRGMSEAERNSEIKKLKLKRENIKNQLAELEKKRNDYQVEERKKLTNTGANQLDEAVMRAARKQAVDKKFTF